MLNFIFGRSGTGKTEYIINHLCSLAQNGEDKLLLIVPEQHSFSAERKIIDKIGEKLAHNIEVLSFSRMADAIFRHSGGFPQTPVNDGMKSVFMSLAIRECRDNLSLYQNQLGKPDFIPIILNTIDEMKSCALSSEALSAFSAAANNETLKQKLSDAALLSATYNALLGNAYSDPLDNLTLIYNKLLKDNIFKSSIIALDGFSGFTRQELMIIEVLLSGAKELYVTLCGSKKDFYSNSELFRITNETRKSITQIAKKNFIQIATPIELNKNHRFHNNSLCILEKNIYSYSPVKDENDSAGVTIYQGVTIYDECRFVSSEIKRLVTECGYKYSDIAVIARDLAPYRGILSRAFDKNNISYFMENPQPLTRQPLIIYVLSALECICSGFSSESVFKMLKTGYSPLNDDEIFELENYSYVWGINGSKWLSPFTQNPEGFKDGFSERDKKKLEYLEAARKKFIEPLKEFKENTQSQTGAQITKELYKFVDSKSVRHKLKTDEQRYIDENNTSKLQELDRIWSILIEGFDRMYFSLVDIKMSIKEYTQLIKLYMSSEDISYIPQSLDEVTVGTADRIRTDSPKVVLMLGCIQDEFPKIPVAAGIFTDNERCVLREQGLPLYESIKQLASNELFYVYTSATAAAERLYVSYYTQTITGEERRESSVVREIISAFKITPDSGSYIVEKGDGRFIRSEQDAFEFLASNFNSDEDIIKDLKSHFKRTDKAAVVEKIELMQQKKALKIDDEAVSRRLFGGNDINISASQIEKFYLCPYQYFCTYGLNIKERKKAEINAAEFGTLVHYILENLLKHNTVAEINEMITEKNLKEKIHLILLEYLNSYLGGEADKTKRFLYGLERIEKGAEILIKYIISELISCGFDPMCCELKIDFESNNGDVEPMSLTLEDGTTVNIRGKIDRVDKMEADGNFYIRIVDYKSGKKDFKINDINFGLNLQMLIYLKAITQNGEKAFNRKITPAGVLYMPAAPNLVSQTDGQAEIDKSYAMDGIVIDNGDSLMQIMNKDGKYIKSKNIMTQSELKLCFDKIDTLIIHMIKSLASGDIGALPVKSGNNDACKYCPYANSCGYENGMKSISLKDASQSPVYYNEEVQK